MNDWIPVAVKLPDEAGVYKCKNGSEEFLAIFTLVCSRENLIKEINLPVRKFVTLGGKPVTHWKYNSFNS